jgi:hypothetical protein
LTAIIDDHIKQNDYTNEIEPQVWILIESLIKSF